MASTVATLDSVRPTRKTAATRRPSFRDNEADRLDRLNRFTHAYWLRPENAYWMTLRSLALKQRPFSSPSADVSCGDGVFSFLHAGGELDPARVRRARAPRMGAGQRRATGAVRARRGGAAGGGPAAAPGAPAPTRSP